MKLQILLHFPASDNIEAMQLDPPCESVGNRNILAVESTSTTVGADQEPPPPPADQEPSPPPIVHEPPPPAVQENPGNLKFTIITVL